MQLLIPAVIGFFIKLYLVLKSKDSLKINNFTSLICVCTMHSLCEIVTFSSYLAGGDAELLFRAYYVLSCWWLCFALIYTLEVSKLSRVYKYIALFVCSAISALLIITDSVISGYISDGYTITADKGNMYYLFQVFALGCIFISSGILIKNVFFKTEDVFIQIKSFYLLAAFSCVFVTVVSIILLMSLGIQFNGLASIPIATTLFAIFVVLTESRHELVDLYRFMPWSIQSQASRQVKRITYLLLAGEITISEAEERFTKLLIETQIKQNKLNCGDAKITKIAKILGVGRSTLYAKIERLNIDKDSLD